MQDKIKLKWIKNNITVRLSYAQYAAQSTLIGELLKVDRQVKFTV